MVQRLKCLPAMWETWVRSLGGEDPLEKEMATHSSTLAWKIPWMEEPCRLQSMGVAKSQTRLNDFTSDLYLYLSGNWEFDNCSVTDNGNPLQCSCLENPRDGGVWWAAIYGVAQSQTRLTRLSSSSSNTYIWNLERWY